MVAIYSTFLQRGYDQLIHDVALQNLPVVFALDRAGIVGADGPTHCGAYDIAFIRCVPNMSLLTPADERETRRALSTAFAQDHPVGVRYPRGAGAGVKPDADLDVLEWGKGEKRREGRRIALLAFGPLLYPALEAAEKLDATVVNMRFVKPLDVELAARDGAHARGTRHARRGQHHGRRGQRGAGGAGRRRRAGARCCNWACPTASSSTATRCA